MASRGDFRGA
jgi:hypothetical protein